MLDSFDQHRLEQTGPDKISDAQISQLYEGYAGLPAANAGSPGNSFPAVFIVDGVYRCRQPRLPVGAVCLRSYQYRTSHQLSLAGACADQPTATGRPGRVKPRSRGKCLAAVNYPLTRRFMATSRRSMTASTTIKSITPSFSMRVPQRNSSGCLFRYFCAASANLSTQRSSEP